MAIKHRSEIEALDERIQGFSIIEDIRWIEVGRIVILSYFTWVYSQWFIYDIKNFIDYLTR